MRAAVLSVLCTLAASANAEVVVNGLEVEREGVYDIQNALVSSNGKIDITIDNESKVTPSRGIFSKLAMHL